LEVDTDGVFGPMTAAAVRQAQKRTGLPTTGEVREKTWATLAAPLKSGAKGEAVRALQQQLVTKHDARLKIDGHFGPATHRAVRRFQTHAELSCDGVVGPGTWTRLLKHYARLTAGGSICAYGDGRSVSNEMWGTASMVGQFRAAADSWIARGGKGRVAVGDVSREHGGNISGHSTHEEGLDVDVRPMRDDGNQCGAKTQWSWATYNRDATRRFVQEIHKRAQGRVKLVWFNDPVLIREGLVQHARGHDNHLHIRYCEPGHADLDYRC
jgi:hypothetical protein